MSGPTTAPGELDRALDALRADFARALERGVGLTVAGMPLRVDQVRAIAALARNDDAWAERGGRRLIRNDTLLGRSLLGYVLGADRGVGAGDFVRILAGIARGDVGDAREDDVAQVVNLVAAEPRHDPRTQPLIWATAAQRLAEGRRDAAFSRDIPGLLTASDPLHEEMAPGAQLADRLLPGSSTPLEPTVERYEQRLHAELGPDLDAYVREHLLSRLGEPPS